MPAASAPEATPLRASAASAQDATPAAPAAEPTGPPSLGRSDTEETVKFNETPTPSPLPPLAKTAATFGEPQPTRAGSSISASAPGSAPGSVPGPRAPRPRTPTPVDIDAMRGFADQRTPGFSDQHTPGFSDQRTPGFSDQRTPSDPAFPRTPTGGPAPSGVSTESTVAAEAAFKRGELAMKRDQPGEAILEYKTACDLNPGEVDYAGMLAWAKFCAAGDKAAIGGETRKILERAVFKSHRPERARFYLGRVERMLGRDPEALRHFRDVLAAVPGHAEAAAELRVLEARLGGGDKPSGGGLFGRSKR
jgi:hypothetical protein